MDKKTECEIVQDLLISYVDNVLNPESKKIVEKHILECDMCKNKFEAIQNDVKEQENVKSKEIDYLKKIRRKAKLKSILFGIVIVFIVFFMYYSYNFIILNNISNKIHKQFETDNFYIKTISNESFEKGVMFVSQVWYKDGKYKKTSHFENSEKIVQKFDDVYGNIKVNSKEEFRLNTENKNIKKENLLYEMNKNIFIPATNPIFLKSTKNNIIFKLGASFYTKISTDNREIGREYYVLELENGKQWIDIDTGLPIMIFGYSSSTQYYKDTKIPIDKIEIISEYQYEFNTVTDEDVELPDLSEFEIDN